MLHTPGGDAPSASRESTSAGRGTNALRARRPCKQNERRFAGESNRKRREAQIRTKVLVCFDDSGVINHLHTPLAPPLPSTAASSSF